MFDYSFNRFDKPESPLRVDESNFEFQYSNSSLDLNTRSIEKQEQHTKNLNRSIKNMELDFDKISNSSNTDKAFLIFFGTSSIDLKGESSYIRIASQIAKYIYDDRAISDEEIETHKKSLDVTILAELGRLEDGWSGHGSVAPTDQIINDVSAILRILKLKSKENLDIQVDDDGRVTFFWLIKPEELLSVDIYGDGKVRCNYSPENFEDSESKIFDVDNHRHIYNFIDSKIDLD